MKRAVHQVWHATVSWKSALSWNARFPAGKVFSWSFDVPVRTWHLLHIQGVATRFAWMFAMVLRLELVPAIAKRRQFLVLSSGKFQVFGCSRKSECLVVENCSNRCLAWSFIRELGGWLRLIRLALLSSSVLIKAKWHLFFGFWSIGVVGKSVHIAIGSMSAPFCGFCWKIFFLWLQKPITLNC